MYLCIFTYVINVCVHIYTYICTHTHIQQKKLIPAHTNRLIRKRVFMHVYVFIYTHIHTHLATQSHRCEHQNTHTTRVRETRKQREQAQ